MILSELKKGKIAEVIGIAGDDAALAVKLREVGFAEGDEVEIMHFGPLGSKPICVRLNSTLIALRPDEASVIEVAVRS